MSIIQKIAFRINTLITPFGICLIRRRNAIDFIRSRKVNMVIDVGANEGQFALSLRKAGYRGHIKSFEPLSGPFQALSALAVKYPPWDVFNFGLSDREEETEINVSKDSTFSSLKKLTPHAAQFSTDSTYIHKEKILLRRLDDVVQMKDDIRPFLKIDTQGYEENVLNGGLTYLESVFGILLEIPIQHIYEDVRKFEDTVAFMRKHSFVISNILPVNFDVGVDDVSLLEVDCIFKNIKL